MKQRFYSNGKLLLSGEYAVLDGALSLALPTLYGQSLELTPTEKGTIKWESRDYKNELWLESEIDPLTLNNLNEGSGLKTRLAQILKTTRKLSPNFLNDGNGYLIKTRLDFPENWGLGSSSTLINNIANWAQINPYVLLENTFGGSGYDIACANHNSPLLYQLTNDGPVVKEVVFSPVFKRQLYFVYLNRKQDSREGIAQYRKQHFDKKHLIDQISEITENLTQCKELIAFEGLLKQHENLMSKTLGLPTIKEALFPDYPGAIKSLGAWGGDFILATGREQTIKYFKNKGYEVVIPYEKMILND